METEVYLKHQTAFDTFNSVFSLFVTQHPDVPVKGFLSYPTTYVTEWLLSQPGLEDLRNLDVFISTLDYLHLTDTMLPKELLNKWMMAAIACLFVQTKYTKVYLPSGVMYEKLSNERDAPVAERKIADFNHFPYINMR